MAVIFKHPDLPDYFTTISAVRADTPSSEIPNIIQPYEGGRVLSFRNLKFDIDHGFWASLPTEDNRKLKKLPSSPAAGDPADDPMLDRRLQDADVPDALKARLKREIVALYEQALPIYEALFDGYRFVRRQVVWRLQTIRNENLHIDTYHTDVEEHFARMFINLDDQPRIWMTSFGIDELYQRFGPEIPDAVLASGDPGAVRKALNTAAFGGRSNIWWDGQPRHVAYFDPGDVWVVDSRQLAHQVFYGRRAVSIDFFVDRTSMGKPKRHYLLQAEAFRIKALRARAQAVPAAAE